MCQTGNADSRPHYPAVMSPPVDSSVESFFSVWGLAAACGRGVFFSCCLAPLWPHFRRAGEFVLCAIVRLRAAGPSVRGHAPDAVSSVRSRYARVCVWRPCAVRVLAFVRRPAAEKGRGGISGARGQTSTAAGKKKWGVCRGLCVIAKRGPTLSLPFWAVFVASAPSPRLSLAAGDEDGRDPS